MKKLFVLLSVLLTAVFSVGPLFAASFDAQTIRVQWIYPEINAVYATQDVVVGPGVEITGFVGNPVDIDISGSQISISLTADTHFGSTSFNGFLFTDINGTIDDITGVAINSLTNMTGLDLSRISFDANNIWINLENLPSNRLNSFVLLDVTFSTTSVPEPATLLLFGLGLIGVAALRRKSGK